MNSVDFIDGLRKQDPVAARHLNECYVPSIWRFVYFRVDGDSHLAEDIVGEAVLALVAAAAAEASIEHPGAWLRTVALRRIQDHFRAAARVQHLIEQAQQQADGSDDQDPAAQHDRKLKRQTVREAMDALPESYRLALEWKYVDRLSVRAIADRIDASEKSVESILFRARRALRDQLQDEHSEPPQRQQQTKASSDKQLNSEANAHADTAARPSESAGGSRTGDESNDSAVPKPSMFFASRLAPDT